MGNSISADSYLDKDGCSGRNLTWQYMHNGHLPAPYSGCMNAAAILHAHGCRKGFCTPGKIDHEFERYTWSNWDGLGEPTDTPLKRTWRPPGITEKLPGSHKVPYAAGDTSRMGSWNGNWTGVIERRTVDLAVDGPEGSAYAGLGLGVGLGMFMSIVIVVLVLTLGFRRGAAANRVRGRGRDLEARKEIGGEDLVGSFEDLMEGADDGYDSKEC